MGYRTKIDWCDTTWNPVTGCLHGCKYCYARGIAERFGSKQMPIFTDFPVLNEPVRCTDTYEYMREAGISTGKVQPYPFDFTPTFHRYKLEEPKKWKKPRNIFVCSMADMFGKWVPERWIREVFAACEAAPQHRYLFLTKNPIRYIDLARNDILVLKDNFWYGSTTEKHNDMAFYTKKSSAPLPKGIQRPRTFISIEPILERFGKSDGANSSVALTDWVIIGAETGNRKDKVIPERDWILELAEECSKYHTPLFMKESLREMMGADFIQEFPWEAKA